MNYAKLALLYKRAFWILAGCGDEIGAEAALQTALDYLTNGKCVRDNGKMSKRLVKKSKPKNVKLLCKKLMNKL